MTIANLIDFAKLPPRFLLLLPVLVLTACERPPIETTQMGYRGTGIVDVQNPRDALPSHALPAVLPPASQDGPRAGDVYQNVQVLSDLSVAEFTRYMTAITSWVSPEEGCNYCHNPANLASDDVYTKVVSRRMLQMTQHINDDWSSHVGENGVNCFTCHRGNPVPEHIWFADAGGQYASAYAGNRDGQNAPAASVGLSSLPLDPFATLLTSAGADDVRVIPTSAFPVNGGASIRDTEATYGLMMHLSDSLGVNCTYCHNSASFLSWEGSTPQRAMAYHGLDMVRALNDEYLTPLQSEYPEASLGPLGDAPKAFCMTCHVGQSKPLGGANAVDGYPALRSGQ